MNDNKILYLSEAEVKSVLPYEKVLELVEVALAEYNAGNAVNPIKLHLPIYPDYEGYINSMPAYLRRLEIAGVKVVSVYSKNMREFQLPSTLGLILLNDIKSGRPYAIMDGTYITACRTGAVMGVMAKYLAKSRSESITIIGTGAQGLASFIMIKLAIPSVREVRMVDLSAKAKENFAKQASALFPDIHCVEIDSIPEACKDVDMVLAAATSKKPLLADIEFSKGTTVLIVEEDITNAFASKFDAFVADFRECLVERINDDAKHHCELTGLPFEELSMETVTAEIGDIIIGKSKGRVNDEQILMAASVGMGVQDIINAKEAYDRAVEKGIGTSLDFLEK